MKTQNKCSKKDTQKNVPLESQEQRDLIAWTRYVKGKRPEVELLFAIPNGGRRDHIEARHLKEQGVKPGVPDLFLPVARGPYHGLFIELKRQKGGTISPAQHRWGRSLTAQGFLATVCYGWKDAAALIEDYLDEKGV